MLQATLGGRSGGTLDNREIRAEAKLYWPE
jgi:hypothetical protein